MAKPTTDRVKAIRAAVKRHSVLRAKRLAGRFQGWLCAFDLVRAPGEGRLYRRRFEPVAGGRVWWDPKTYPREAVDALIRAKVWQPIEGTGRDMRPLLRPFAALLSPEGVLEKQAADL